MIAHAKLGASNSHRWLNCPGSVAAEANAAGRKGGRFADEGSVAHELADLCLSGGLNPFDFEGRTLIENNAVSVDRDMCGHVQTYIDYVQAIPGVHEYERRVDYSDWVPDGFGTSDVIAVHGDTIHIVDLKYGKGVEVYAKDNSQMMLYALGAYSEYACIQEINTVRMSIVQPRRDHIDEWQITVPELLKWAAWVSEQAELALSDDAPRSPGEKQCQFCAVKATCPALEAFTRKIVGGDFDNLDDPDALPDERVSSALAAKKLILGWLDAVEQHVTERLESGKGFPGFKLVAGRSLRQWSDESKAEEVLSSLVGDDAFTRKLVSPAQAEKLLGKAKAADIADLIVKPEGRPTIAPESDKRPAINLTKDDFDCLQS